MNMRSNFHFVQTKRRLAHRLLSLGAVALIAGLHALGAEPSVTFSSLLREMADRDLIARWPRPAYALRQASSYDRTQTDPNDSRTWFNNNDSAQFVRIETNHARKEWVQMEHDGPGCITRAWIPLEKSKDRATIRFYFDGSDQPGIEANFNALMRGKLFIKPPFAFVAFDLQTEGPEATNARSQYVAGDLYLPIPFARGCRITLDEVPFYYAFGYRCYAPGTTVQTFSRAEFDASQALVEQTGKILVEAADVVDGRSLSVAKVVHGGQELKLKLPRGPTAVRNLEIKLRSAQSRHALRSTVFKMAADREATIWCPLSEFSGSGVTLKPVKDWYRTVESDGTITLRWVMPYRKSAEMAVLNLGKTELDVKLTAHVGRWKWDEGSMHFHAGWRHQYPLATIPHSDWNYTEITGQGTYVGDTLTAMNENPYWYGEGDERIFTDGEKFPSQLGTGTEDYYGYAWGMGWVFSSPFISMPQRDNPDRGNWLEYTTTSRVRALDAIPFLRSLKVDMEISHHRQCQVAYGVGSFWYARPGAKSNRVPLPDEASRPLPQPPGTAK